MAKVTGAIVGFPRCGTSASIRLASAINNVRSFIDEPGYFHPSVYPNALNDFFDKVSPQFNYYEKGPLYSHNINVMRNLKDHNKDMKITCCIRHPISHLHSFYDHRFKEYANNKFNHVNLKELGFHGFVLSERVINGLSVDGMRYRKHLENNVFPVFNKDTINYVEFHDVIEIVKDVNRLFNEERFSPSVIYSTIDYSNPLYNKALGKLLKISEESINEMEDLLGYKINKWRKEQEFYQALYDSGNCRPLYSKVIHIVGLSGSGKTTISNMIKNSFGDDLVIIDGDDIRKELKTEGYDDNQREVNHHRIAYVADMVSKAGKGVIIASMAPTENTRRILRDRLGDRYAQVYLECDIEELIKRDTKGIYSDPKVKNISGIDAPFDPPKNPDLSINTKNTTEIEAFEKVKDFIINKA